jgi:hypothetical protein
MLMRDFYGYMVNEHFDPPHALQRAKKNAASKAEGTTLLLCAIPVVGTQSLSFAANTLD